MRRSLCGWMPILALARPAAGTALDDGARLYECYCAACHGRDGKGGVGVPLALTAFQSTVSERYLESTMVRVAMEPARRSHAIGICRSWRRP